MNQYCMYLLTRNDALQSIKTVNLQEISAKK